MRGGLVLAAAVAALDQLVKFWVLEFFMARPGENGVDVLPFFNLVLAWNRGVSFGLFNSGSARGTLLFAALAAIIVAALLLWLKRAGRGWLALAIGLVIGGALGNIIDRIFRGAVVDFLDFHWGDWHWFAFNLADTAITLGVVFIALDGMLGERRRAGLK
ncbi:MAG TPA: signal peptidase II [Stellaceae bacterium]|nr:signal peptidase II [Stellaceae bacterium]